MHAVKRGGDVVAGSSASTSTAAGRWAQKHSGAIDAVVAAALFLYDAMYLEVQHVGPAGLPRPLFVVALALSAGMCAAYLFRRKWPRAVPTCIYVAAWGYVALGVGLSPAPLVLLALALYFLAARSDRRIVVLAVLLAAAWIIAAAQPLMAKGYLRIGEVGVLVLAGGLIAAIGLLAQARRGRLEALRERADRLVRERDARAAIATAEERARIAREIHDIVSHSLGTMVVMADGAARTAVTAPEQAGQAMERVRDTGREAMGEMRMMLDVLREDDGGSRAPQPGLSRLERLIDESRATGLRVDLRITGDPVALPAGIDLTAYRIVQEALTNARKHGGPLLSAVAVTVSYLDGAVALRIADDGAGAPAGADDAVDEPLSSGHGLVGMRERARAHGGSLQAGPRSEGGFEVRVTLPIGEDS